MKYGFIGCGNMGGAIARALSKATKDFAVSDRSGKGKALAEELGCVYSTPQKIIEACRIAEADEMIRQQEKGYDTQLGERGAGLSEGQLQRLAIARAIYSEKPVLLLDEATSALDEATEAKVLENLQRLKNRTVIIVTHRKAALDICNRIVEMDNGRIREWDAK